MRRQAGHRWSLAASGRGSRCQRPCSNTTPQVGQAAGSGACGAPGRGRAPFPGSGGRDGGARGCERGRGCSWLASVRIAVMPRRPAAAGRACGSASTSMSWVSTVSGERQLLGRERLDAAQLMLQHGEAGVRRVAAFVLARCHARAQNLGGRAEAGDAKWRCDAARQRAERLPMGTQQEGRIDQGGKASGQVRAPARRAVHRCREWPVRRRSRRPRCAPVRARRPGRACACARRPSGCGWRPAFPGWSASGGLARTGQAVMDDQHRARLQREALCERQMMTLALRARAARAPRYPAGLHGSPPPSRARSRDTPGSSAAAARRRSRRCARGSD